MSQATTTTTGGFPKCFPQWVNADQVQISCNDPVSNRTVTLIAQYCSPDHQSCRNMSSPAVFLEKDKHRVCLTITNCSYDSWSCEAKSYTNGEEDKENFTVSITCNCK
ncbi:Transforming growth factor beta-1-induced transcript 1 protein [Labeo rohita]|uniref:Transforming growth factor beta-1-induced transcript 1 protein n=1 Tax=Labeo rohita TaxID=84645 RepID=A0ABQ8L4Z5_LABRO|nr:Transforming growth factor beta-1-induced transcript 1 protein [Labeo rohita]